MLTQNKVTREELETKLNSFQDDIQGLIADRSEQIRMIKITSAIVALLGAFLFGRRSGQKNRSQLGLDQVVEQSIHIFFRFSG